MEFVGSLMSSATCGRNFFVSLRFTKQITPLLAVHQQ
jgi:hypothetical protein